MTQMHQWICIDRTVLSIGKRNTFVRASGDALQSSTALLAQAAPTIIDMIETAAARDAMDAKARCTEYRVIGE